jgi:arsenate reductase-like glutaredoxin family protein
VLLSQRGKAALCTIRKNAKAYCKSFLKDHTSTAAVAQDLTKEHVINIILQCEGTKKVFRSLYKYLRPGEFSSRTEVHIKKSKKSIEIISHPQEMFQRPPIIYHTTTRWRAPHAPHWTPFGNGWDLMALLPYWLLIL